MNREDLEHIIRASADVTNQYEFVIVGSQSILGSIPYPNDVFKMSAEADIYPLNDPELADKIDGAIGEGSQFHELNGYYAQGVGPETAVLAIGWEHRLHRVQNGNTNDRVGHCLDVLDLFLSKAAAARDKDREFCSALIEHGYVKLEDALHLVASMPLDDGEKPDHPSCVIPPAKLLHLHLFHGALSVKLPSTAVLAKTGQRSEISPIFSRHQPGEVLEFRHIS